MSSRFYRITRVVTPAPSLALITLDQAKTALGIPLADTSKDADIQALIAAVSTAANNYCNRIFAVQGYQDQCRFVAKWWNGIPEPLRIAQVPIVLDAGVPVLTVKVDGINLDPERYETDPEVGALYRLDGPSVTEWPGQTILIDYSAGFDPIPADVQKGALEWLRADWAASGGQIPGRDPAVRSETAFDVASFTYFDWAGSSGSNSTQSTPPPPNAAKWLMPYQLVIL